VYAVDNIEKTKHELSKKILLEIIDTDKCFALSIQNLSEFISVSTKKISNPISLSQAREIIERLSELPNLKILNIGTKTIILATEISEKYKIHYWDALIAAVMKENMITEIITENESDFSKIPWIEVINPFG